MSDDNDDLRSIKVYKFDNTTENRHDFALKFRDIADGGGYGVIINGTKTPLTKENIEIHSDDDVEVQRAKKEEAGCKSSQQEGL